MQFVVYLFDFSLDFGSSFAAGVFLRTKHFYLILGFRTGFYYCILVRTCSRADFLPLEIYIAGGDVIQLYNRTTGRSLTASGLADKTERLTFFYLEADVVNRLEILVSHPEILAKMIDL